MPIIRKKVISNPIVHAGMFMEVSKSLVKKERLGLKIKLKKSVIIKFNRKAKQTAFIRRKITEKSIYRRTDL